MLFEDECLAQRLSFGYAFVDARKLFSQLLDRPSNDASCIAKGDDLGAGLENAAGVLARTAFDEPWGRKDFARERRQWPRCRRCRRSRLVVRIDDPRLTKQLP